MPCEALFIIDVRALFDIFWTVEQKHPPTAMITLGIARTIFFIKLWMDSSERRESYTPKMHWGWVKHIFGWTNRLKVYSGLLFLALFQMLLCIVLADAPVVLKVEDLYQGSSNRSLEAQSAAKFSSNPDQTHLPVIFLMILKTLISMLRCVWLGLELNSAGMVQIWGSLIYTDSYWQQKKVWLPMSLAMFTCSC